MLAVKVLDVKKCMHEMLVADTFHIWQLLEAKLIGRISYVIDGHITKGYLSTEELEEEGLSEKECIPYEMVRPMCYEMTKGKHTPKYFRQTFLMPRKDISAFLQTNSIQMQPENVANLTVNFTFAEGELIVTTSSAMQTFSLDKSLDEAWDSWVLEFLRKIGVTVEKVA